MPGPSLADIQSLPQIDRDILFSQMGLTQEQGNQDEMLSQLAQQVAQAQQGVQSAQQDYSNLAAMPPPSSGAPETIRNLFANIASGVTGNPVYSQQAGEINTQNLSSAVEFRKAQLDTLHDALLRRATLAQSLGNLEVSTKATMQAGRVAGERHKLDKLEEDKRQFAQDRVMRDLEHQNRMAEIAAQGAQTRQTKQATANEITPDDLNSMIRVTGTGDSFVDISTVPPAKKYKVQTMAAQQGMMALDKPGVEKSAKIDEALENIQTMKQIVKDRVEHGQMPSQGGLEWLSKWVPITASGVLKTDPIVAAWPVWRLTAIQQLQALTTGPGSGMRLVREEIRLATKNDIPNMTDTGPAAVQKLENVENLVKRRAKTILNSYWGSTPIRMKSPTGEVGMVPADKVQEALLKGARIVEAP